MTTTSEVGVPAQTSGDRREWPRRSLDDIGNAERLVDHYGSELRYLIDAEQWAVYEGGRWMLKGAKSLLWKRVVQTIKALPNTEAFEYSATRPASAKDDKKTERDAFMEWVSKSRYRGRLAAMRDVAESEAELFGEMGDFDQHEVLLNVKNGVVDLRTGELMPHDPELYLMQQSPVRFDPHAKCPQWMAFLDSVMPDPDRRAYLQRVVGYTLTGSTDEQVMFVHHGTGMNGKSVFIEVVMGLLGDYAQAVPRTTLLAKKEDGIPNDVARMVGKRLLSTTETSAGKKLDDELVKQLTGQDMMSARFLHGEYFDFKPVGKIHLATNYLPKVGSGHGITRRLHDIGWDVTVPPEARIPKLAEKVLRTEAAGVLNWALEGVREWRKHGLAMPEAVRAKTAQHIAESDPISMWIEDNTEVCDRDPHISGEVTGNLFQNYKLWCQNGSLREMSVMAFSQALEERGYEKTKHPKHRRAVILGLRVKPQGF
ncbi:phage/plasmid primase, P4 family [Streptomyces erythrochromogenes]|uniref:DNA primase family protein n=1 Tax=Streptomyces erythrochromogenes TaxID=285574 RepID=UPI002F9152DB|nr:phage/plasmid primase, P4 family [Streptomyces erythrochromogenes]WSR88921.1 phage/plasmid primase, P4 family [Streptomyces erythrochromogenes]